jgi:hypothetical protein
MLAGAVTHPPSTQGIASRVVAPQRFASSPSLAAMVATSELLVESFGRPVPERLDPPFPDLRPPEVIQVDPPERERPKPPPTAPGPPRAVRRRTGSPPPGRPAAPRRRWVAPAWSWSWTAARPGGTGSWSTGPARPPPSGPSHPTGNHPPRGRSAATTRDRPTPSPAARPTPGSAGPTTSHTRPGTATASRSRTRPGSRRRRRGHPPARPVARGGGGLRGGLRPAHGRLGGVGPPPRGAGPGVPGDALLCQPRRARPLTPAERRGFAVLATEVALGVGAALPSSPVSRWDGWRRSSASSATGDGGTQAEEGAMFVAIRPEEVP